VFYYPGEMVWTHLVKQGDDYTTTWWNSHGELVHKTDITTCRPGPARASRLLDPHRASPTISRYVIVWLDGEHVAFAARIAKVGAYGMPA
jgi:hypothetical protein